ncbi:MAG: hypothetical protein ACM3UU_02220 [Ignavibacteriales bacterium]
MKKVLNGIFCAVCLMILFSASPAQAEPSGTVGDSYYMFTTGTCERSEPSSKYYYNGSAHYEVEVGHVSDEETYNYIVEVTPVVPSIGMGTFYPVIREYTSDVNRYRIYNLYIEDLPYPGTMYYYTVRLVGQQEISVGSFTTTGTAPAWIANPVSSGGGGAAGGDTEPPELTLLWQGNKTTIAKNTSVKLVVIVQDNISAIGKIKLEYSKDDGSIYTEFNKDANQKYTQSANITFSEGNKFVNVLVRATDEAGRQSMGYKTIYVTE